MRNRILVTGGTGFIGSHTVVELIEHDFDVVIIDDLSNSTAEIVDKIEEITGIRPYFHKLDLCDMSALKNCLETYDKIDGIIHFAASKAVGESVVKPLLYYRNNLVSLMNLIECMYEFEIPNMVFSSSCTVYGQPDKLPVDETAVFKEATSPYGNTKQICEDIIRDVANASPSFNFTALRYFNPVGAHKSGLIGELPSGVPSNLVPFITQTAAGIIESLKVFGDDYDTHDGTAVRDYIHVVDLAKAHVKTVERLLSGKGNANYEYFNVGTGKGYTVKDVINAFEKVTGVKLNYEIAPRREGDIEKIYADPSLANIELEWKAEKSIDEMMKSAWQWQKNLMDQ
ncbi:MAG: UDP-glucose 4-epimerase GalE [Cyclobacteriaceae bacterium]